MENIGCFRRTDPASGLLATLRGLTSLLTAGFKGLGFWFKVTSSQNITKSGLYKLVREPSVHFIFHLSLDDFYDLGPYPRPKTLNLRP